MATPAGHGVGRMKMRDLASTPNAVELKTVVSRRNVPSVHFKEMEMSWKTKFIRIDLVSSPVLSLSFPRFRDVFGKIDSPGKEIQSIIWIRVIKG